MKGVVARLKRLEIAAANAAVRRQSEDDIPPLCEGVPHEVGRGIYLIWLRRRLTKPGLPAQEIAQIGQTIDDMQQLIRWGIEDLRVREEEKKLMPFEKEEIAWLERVLAGDSVEPWPPQKRAGVWLKTPEGQAWEAQAPPNWNQRSRLHTDEEHLEHTNWSRRKVGLPPLPPDYYARRRNGEDSSQILAELESAANLTNESMVQ